MNTIRENFRVWLAFLLAIVGIVAVLSLIIILVSRGWEEADNIVSVVSILTTLIGSLVGLFLGVQVGAQGKEDAERRARSAQRRLGVIQSFSPPEIMSTVTENYPEIFKD
ncbi:MAG: hypothetical protein AAF490_22695 [Chloroflexota bacterium]